MSVNFENFKKPKPQFFDYDQKKKNLEPKIYNKTRTTQDSLGLKELLLDR